MTLLTRLQYRHESGDLTTLDADVDDAIPKALDALERYLERPLELASRTEIVKLHSDGRAYPRATPIQSVSDPANAIIQGACVLGLRSIGNPLWDIVYEPYRYGAGGIWDRTMPVATLTYTGGFDVLPPTLFQALIDLVRAEVTSFPAVPVGAVTRASVGDTSVEYATPAATTRAAARVTALTGVRGYKYRQEGY